MTRQPETDTERELRRQLGDIGITVDRLERTVRALGEANIQVRGEIGRLRANPDPAPTSAVPVVEWMTVEDPEAAAAALVDLRTWVHRVWDLYDPIASCWPWHPPVVAELMACRKVWVAATSKTAPSLAAADWHARFRLSALKAVTGRLKHCDDTQGHRFGEEKYWDVDHQQIDDLARWWASGHGSPNSGTAPGLTPKEHS